MCRHGSTKLNAQSAGESNERLRAWSDVPLDNNGKKDAQELAKKLAHFPIERIYSSPLSRAKETADAVGEIKGLPVEETRSLLPWNLGYMTAQLVKDVLPEMKRFIKNENNKVPGGESFATFRQRTLSFIRRVAQEAARDQKVICCVAHTRDCQLTKAWLAAGAPDDLHIDDATMDDYSKEVAPGGFLEVDVGDVLGPEWKTDAGQSDDTQ